MIPRSKTLGLLLLAVLCLSCRSRREAASPAKAPTGIPANAVVVKISYGSEKKGFLTESIEEFHRRNPKTAEGRPIRIEAVAEGSAESMEAILAGESDVHVWSPASSILIDVLNDRWAEAHPQLGTGAKLVGEAPPLLLSPVVIAIWEPMAKALGWPARGLGWRDLAGAATKEGGWNRFGRPEWGSFKLGHTHPRYSNSGLITLVAATYAGTGKTRNLTLADVKAAAPFVKSLEAAIVHYGRSTGFFAEEMRKRGPSYLSAAVLYENLVVEGALVKESAAPFPIVAVYPKEGTFWSDHPWALLDLPRVTPEVRAAAEQFRKFLLSEERQRRALSRYGFRPADPAIPVGPPIDAEHGLDPKQPANVLPNPPVAVTRRILDSFEDVKRPVAVTFVLDVSGSMKGEPMKQAKAGARVFLETLPDGDLVRVLFFSTKLRWSSQDYGKLAGSRQQLVGAVEDVFADGGTALYDAILAAAAPSPDDPKEGVRGVVVLTDGKDTDSKVQLEQLLDQLRGRETGESARDASAPRIFTVAYGSEADPAVLKKIAEAGGGAFFSGTPKNIKSVYAELASFF